MNTPAGPVAVMGAGSVGCFVGGRLQAAGVPVHFVGRPRVLQALRRQGLTLSDLDGGQTQLPADRLSLHEAPPAGAALVLLCTKSGATAEAAAQLAAVCAPGTPVLSLQNGVANAAVAAAAAPALDCIAGMVPFNVAELGPGRYHRGTFGRLAAQRHPALAAWLPAFERAGLPLALHDDLRPVQWGKLLLNLNNPVNALSGLPLRAELLEHDCRVVWAALQAEALAALRRAGIQPAALTPVAPPLLPHLLRLPTPLFRRLAARMLKVDEKARSSMADDLALGRPTEIDAICGAVVRLAADHGLAAPRCARMVELLSVPQPQPLGPAALRRALAL
jgi:2-dehydropantoate 2-reductase